jgi:hypothetical protein
VSAAPGLERPAGRVRSRGPRLSLVPAARPAPRGPLRRKPFVAVVVSLLAAGLLGLLMLNTALAQDAFELHTLKQESRALEDREELLRREVEALQAPQELAARATELGMVPAGPPAFLRLSDGAVLGSTTPAEAPVDADAPVDAEAPVDPEAPVDADVPAEAPADAPADETAEDQ